MIKTYTNSKLIIYWWVKSSDVFLNWLSVFFNLITNPKKIRLVKIIANKLKVGSVKKEVNSDAPTVIMLKLYIIKTVWVWVYPPSTSLWCRWFLSALNGDCPFNARIIKTLNVSNSGYIKEEIAKTGLFTFTQNQSSFWTGNSISLMANTHKKTPITSEPESPIKIFAGEKLKIKKPTNEPAKANDKAA